MEGGSATEQICISLVNERAVLNPQSIHSLAKIFAVVEPPSNGGGICQCSSAPDQRNAMFVREIEGRRVWIGTLARVCNLLGTSGSWTEPLRPSHFPCNIKDDREEP